MGQGGPDDMSMTMSTPGGIINAPQPNLSSLTPSRKCHHQCGSCDGAEGQLSNRESGETPSQTKNPTGTAAATAAPAASSSSSSSAFTTRNVNEHQPRQQYHGITSTVPYNYHNSNHVSREDISAASSRGCNNRLSCPSPSAAVSQANVVSPSQYASLFVAQQQSIVNNNHNPHQQTPHNYNHNHQLNDTSHHIRGGEYVMGGDRGSHLAIVVDNRNNASGAPPPLDGGGGGCQSGGGSLTGSGSIMGVDKDCEEETASSSSPAFPNIASSSSVTYFSEQPHLASDVILHPCPGGGVVPTPNSSSAAASGAFHTLHHHHSIENNFHPSLPFCTNAISPPSLANDGLTGPGGEVIKPNELAPSIRNHHFHHHHQQLNPQPPSSLQQPPPPTQLISPSSANHQPGSRPMGISPTITPCFIHPLGGFAPFVMTPNAVTGSNDNNKVPQQRLGNAAAAGVHSHKNSNNNNDNIATNNTQIMLTDQALHDHNLSNNPLMNKHLVNDARLHNFATGAGNWTAMTVERQAFISNAGANATMTNGSGGVGQTAYMMGDMGGEGASDDTGTINSDQLNTSIPPPPPSMSGAAGTTSSSSGVMRPTTSTPRGESMGESLGGQLTTGQLDIDHDDENSGKPRMKSPPNFHTFAVFGAIFFNVMILPGLLAVSLARNSERDLSRGKVVSARLKGRLALLISILSFSISVAIYFLSLYYIAVRVRQ